LNAGSSKTAMQFRHAPDHLRSAHDIGLCQGRAFRQTTEGFARTRSNRQQCMPIMHSVVVVRAACSGNRRERRHETKKASSMLKCQRLGPASSRLNVVTALLTKGRLARLTSTQSAVLLACYGLPHPSVRGIALFLRASRASVSHSLKVLMGRGLIECATDPTDRRGIIAIRTSPGEELVRTVYRICL
jgi:DNA-binding MarR family transcriptional regulator